MKAWGVILVNEKMAYCGDKDKFVMFPVHRKKRILCFVLGGEWKFPGRKITQKK